MPFYKYTQDNGISSYNTTKIIQDEKGFIWVGTQEGLNRFDGNTFIGFTKLKNQKKTVPSGSITDMFEKNGLIWVATSYDGIASINIDNLSVKNRIERLGNIDFSAKWIRCITMRDIVLWIGTSTGLYAYNSKNETIKSVLNTDNCGFTNAELSFSKVIFDKFNRIWAFCDKGIFILNGSSGEIIKKISLKMLNYENNPKPFNVWGACKHNDEVYIATSWGLRQFKYSEHEIMPNKWELGFPFLKNEVFDCMIDKNNKLWIACSNGLLTYDLKTNLVNRIRDYESPLDGWQTSVFTICNDFDNNIWLGSQEGVAFIKNRQQAFSSYFKSITNNIQIQHAYTLCVPDDGNVYCGAVDGLYSVNLSDRLFKKIISGTTFYLVHILPDKNILVSCDQGLYVIHDNLIKKAPEIYPELKGIEPDLLNSAINYNDDTIFLGSHLQKGFYEWNPHSGKIYRKKVLDTTMSKNLSYKTINGLYSDKRRMIWIISDNFLERFTPQTNETKMFQLVNPKTKQPLTILYNMCETDSSFWISAYGQGVIETDKDMHVKRVISQKDGLNSIGIDKIFNIGDSSIIITTNNGVSLLNYKTNKISSYFKSDGLNSSAFETFCGIKYNNKIYAGGVNGFTIIDPQYFTTNTTPPKFYFNNIKTETTDNPLDTSNLEITHLSIPNNWLQTNVSFVGLNYSNPERVTYQYRLIGQNNTWLNLGTQNFVNLIGLNPGTYTLEVKAANEDGVWCEPKSLTLTFLPKWYQTLWFNIAVVLAVAGLGYAFYLYRIRQIQKQHKIRVDIASDLHDDIGSALNTVKVFTHLAKRDVDKTEHINQIEESLTQATTGLRDMIWILDDGQDTLDEILERIKKFAIPVTMAHGITLDCINQAAGDEQAVSKTKKRNLLLIAKECINNSIKYAGCTHIQVELNQHNKKVQLIIKDNGQGFNMATTPQGNGLGNIRYRAKQISAVAEITSAEGAGTTVKITQK